MIFELSVGGTLLYIFTQQLQFVSKKSYLVHCLSVSHQQFSTLRVFLFNKASSSTIIHWY